MLGQLRRTLNQWLDVSLAFSVKHYYLFRHIVYHTLLLLSKNFWQDEDNALLNQAIAMSVGDVNMSEAADEDQDLALGE